MAEPACSLPVRQHKSTRLPSGYALKRAMSRKCGLFREFTGPYAGLSLPMKPAEEI
jgi:hypothetical protein